MAKISIHALREEGDGCPHSSLQRLGISIHALREEGDRFCMVQCNHSKDFYPRPPRGGRPTFCVFCKAFLTFLSTPSARRATDHCRGRRWACGISIHALREEGDSFLRLCGKTQTPFLSTPSARRATEHLRGQLGVRDISIHALREEGDATIPANGTRPGRFLSTPSARRATGICTVLSLIFV